jgi:hypothetical protein
VGRFDVTQFDFSRMLHHFERLELKPENFALCSELGHFLPLQDLLFVD